MAESQSASEPDRPDPSDRPVSPENASQRTETAAGPTLSQEAGPALVSRRLGLRTWRKMPDEFASDVDLLGQVRADLALAADELDPHHFSIPTLSSKLPSTASPASADSELGVSARTGAGRNLEELVQSGVAPTVAQAIEVTAQLAERLNVMHESKLTHEGVTAQHVAINSDGSVKLLQAGSRQLFRLDVPVGFEPADASDDSWDEDAIRRADLRGCLRILAYILACSECRSRAFPEFVERLQNDRGGHWLARRLRHVDRGVHDLVLDELSRISDSTSTTKSPGQLAEDLRSLLQGSSADLRPLVTGGRSEWASRKYDTVHAARRQAAFASAMLVILVAALYVAPLLWTRHQPSLPGREDPDTVRLLTLPGKNGTWWAEDPDTYWLIPQLRLAMVEHGFTTNASNYSTTSAANDQAKDRKTGGETAGPERGDIYRVLQAWNPLQRSGEVRAGVELQTTLNVMRTSPEVQAAFPVVEALVPRSGITPARFHNALAALQGDSAETLHTRAVLLHRLALLAPPDSTPAIGEADAGPYVRAEVAYRAALLQYRRQPWHKLELLALCYADYGELLSAQKKLTEAADAFRQARLLVDRRGDGNRVVDRSAILATVATIKAKPDFAAATASESPSPLPLAFLIDCLCKESQCHRSLDQPALALDRVLEALQLSFTKGTPLVARGNALERTAWLHMDLWDLDAAGSCFEAAKATRENGAHFPSGACAGGRCETFLRVQHIQHGIAMVERYRGVDESIQQARNDYKSILAALTKSQVDPLRSDERDQLEARLLNSQQRYVDSFVYAPTLHDSEEERRLARETIRRALATVRRLAVLKKDKAAYEARLLSQWALVELVAGQTQRARKVYERALRSQTSSDSEPPFPLEILGFYFGTSAATRSTASATTTAAVASPASREAGGATESSANLDTDDSRPNVREVVLSIERRLGPMRNAISRDDLDVLLLIGRVLSADLNREPPGVADETLIEDRQLLAFLLHSLLIAPQQRQANAGIFGAGTLPKDYFKCHYEQLQDLLGDDSEELNGTTLERMRKVDPIFDRILRLPSPAGRSGLRRGTR